MGEDIREHVSGENIWEKDEKRLHLSGKSCITEDSSSQ
jgi:hypothetical protein